MNRVSRYSVAVVAVVLACGLTWLLRDLLAPMKMFFFWGAVLATAAVAGSGPAAVAIALSVVGSLVVAFEPIGAMSMAGVDALRLALFVLFAGSISFAVGRRRREELRAERATAAARLNELRYRTLVEATPVPQAVWTATPDGRVSWSDAWLTITGLTRADVEAGDGLRAVHPADAPRTWERWNTALADETPYDDEIRVCVKDGRWRWFAIRAVPVRVDGRVAEWIGIVVDITERKRHEEQSGFLNRASELLASSLDYQRTLRNLARLCVPALGDWCAIHFATDDMGYERVAAEHSDPAKIQLLDQLEPRVRVRPGTDPIVQAMRSGEAQIVETVTEEMLAASGMTEEQLQTVRTLGFGSWIVAPMMARGRMLGTLTVVHGESGRRYSPADVPLIEDLARRAATAIENARLFEAAEAANRAKDEFLATLSHELRTPLTAIAGWAHMLQAGLNDEQTARLAVETIVRSAHTQAELIDDLLDLSRVVAGTLHLNVTTVDLASIVDDVLVAARPAADAKGLTLEQGHAIPALVRGDERRLRQVVWNLVSNAVKFTDAGGSIAVSLAVRDRYARLEVRDTGRGIEASFLPHVWDRFRQADSSTSRQHGGLGLGLAVVRHLVELHGGTVGVESEGRDRGARFAIEIPLARLDSAASSAVRTKAKRETPLTGRKVLVVDDDADARVVLTAMLRQQGAEVMSAESAESALKAIEQQSFDAIVSDIAMPGEDGYSLARRVRTRSEVPMVAVSAIASGAGDRDRARAEGFDEFLRKPVDPKQLAEVVRMVMLNRNR